MKEAKDLPRLYTDEEIENTTFIIGDGINCFMGPYFCKITDPEQIRIIMEGCRVRETVEIKMSKEKKELCRRISKLKRSTATTLYPNGSDKSFSEDGPYYTEKDPEKEILLHAIWSNLETGFPDFSEYLEKNN